MPAPPSSVVTSGIFSVSNSTTDAILHIEPSVFMAPVDQDLDKESDPALADPDFQAYITNTWTTFQADRKNKGKRVQFNGVELLARKTGCPGPQCKDCRMAGRTKDVRHTCPELSKGRGEMRYFVPKGTQGKGGVRRKSKAEG